MELNYIPYFPKSKNISILDIGCGKGEILLELKRLGYVNSKGIGADPKKIEICKDLNLDVELISDFKTYLDNKLFGVIILKTVIAHFPKEQLMSNLAAIKNSLNVKGILLVETTNAAILTGYYMLSNDFTHWQYFTEWSLKEILSQTGFSDIKVFGKKAKIKSVKFLVWTTFRFFWFLILRLIYLIERGKDQNPTIFSKSLIAVCRK